MNDRVQAALTGWRSSVRLNSLDALEGGASSLTFLAGIGSAGSDGTAATGCPSRIVVKSAPPGLAPVRNRDVLRQARLLRGVTDKPGVRVPTVLFEDAGEPPDVPPFFAMDFVSGESIEPNIDLDVEAALSSPEVLTARAHSAAAVLAALHRVSPADAGLADEPEVTAGDEVQRWAKALATVDETITGGRDDCAAALQSSIPSEMPSALIHGDFRLGNCLSEGSDVTVVIDWEIWAHSDPRIDLAWFLLTADPDLHPSTVRRAAGMPRPAELLQTYRSAGGPPVSDLDWFTGLMLYKLAAVSGLIAKNALKRGDPDGMGARAAAGVPETLRRARATIG